MEFSFNNNNIIVLHELLMLMVVSLRWWADDSPIIEGTGPKQQPTRNRNWLLFFDLGEASSEVDEKNSEEWNVPTIKQDRNWTIDRSPLDWSISSFSITFISTQLKANNRTICKILAANKIVSIWDNLHNFMKCCTDMFSSNLTSQESNKCSNVVFQVKNQVSSFSVILWTNVHETWPS